MSGGQAQGGEIEDFTIAVPDPVLADLDERLARTRLAGLVEGVGWEAGFPPDYLADLVAHWRDAFDWRAEERRLNALAHHRTVLDGQAVHFVHLRSPHPGAFPLLLVHGWPGSFLEFLDAAAVLVDPPAQGGRADDAFDLVIPSLPGYGFSDPPRTPGWDVDRIAGAFAALMARLGYRRYGAQGGDWGAQVTTRMALADAAHCAGLHLNMALGAAPGDGDPADTEAADELAALQRFQHDEGAYAALQGTKPQTVGAALDDSPAGLLAWIVEKFRAWSDCDGDPERAFPRDRLLANVTLYWVTRTATSSARLYWESRRTGSLSRRLPFVEVPTGVARYPKEVLRWPRSWVERQYRVTHWAEMPRGGHFAAMEQPALFADDLRAFFRTVR
ncbi:MAG: epoxide hydrolase family protein [Acidimicrobiales bacterium]